MTEQYQAQDGSPNSSLTRPSVLQLSKTIYREFSSDRIPTVAAAITFFFLLAIFPAIASVVSLYGMIADRATIAHEVDQLINFLPSGAISVLDTELQRLAARKPQTLSIGFLAGLAVALWSASGGVGALIEGLNVAFEAPETRSFMRLTLNTLLFTIIAVVMAVGTINLMIVIPNLLDVHSTSTAVSTTFQTLKWPAIYFIYTALLSIIYRFGPNRKLPWRLWTWGGSIASALWILGTLGFSWYVQNYGTYDQVYGSLGAAVGFLTWVWISVMILLLGAEINCELLKAKRSNRGAHAAIAR